MPAKWVIGPSGRKIKVGGPTWSKLSKKIQGELTKKPKSVSKKSPKGKVPKSKSKTKPKTPSPKSPLERRLPKNILAKGKSHNISLKKVFPASELVHQVALHFSKSAQKISPTLSRIIEDGTSYDVMTLKPTEVRNYKLLDAWGYGHPIIGYMVDGTKIWIKLTDPKKPKPSVLIYYPYVIPDILGMIDTFLKKKYELRTEGEYLFNVFFDDRLKKGIGLVDPSGSKFRPIPEDDLVDDEGVFYFSSLFKLLISWSRDYLEKKTKKSDSEIEEMLLEEASYFMEWMMENRPDQLVANYQNYELGWVRSAKKEWTNFIKSPTLAKWEIFADKVQSNF